MAVVNNSGLTLHIRQLDGVNSHHIVEACFRLLPGPCAWPRRWIYAGLAPSPAAKGYLSRLAPAEAASALHSPLREDGRTLIIRP